MTRPAIPVQFKEANQKSLRTSKKELAVRREIQEQHSIGSSCIFKPHTQVQADQEALEKFNEVTELYISANASFVTSADNDLINRYCLVYSEYMSLVNITNTLREKAFNTHDADDVDIFLKSDKAVNNKALLLLKLGSQLYLDPKSRATISQMTIKHTEKMIAAKNNNNNDDDLF